MGNENAVVEKGLYWWVFNLLNYEENGDVVDNKDIDRLLFLNGLLQFDFLCFLVVVQNLGVEFKSVFASLVFFLFHTLILNFENVLVEPF